MCRNALYCAVVMLAAGLFGCRGMDMIGQQDLSGKPTVYAQVNKEPEPALLGCYLRSRPGKYNRPNKYEYCLVKESGGYALFYYMMDGKTLRSFKGWSPASINGDCLTADYDGSTYCVKDGEVWQHTIGGGGPHRMLPMH
ncbi:hypothetical protein [Solidesulfovibrio sp.]